MKTVVNAAVTPCTRKPITLPQRPINEHQECPVWTANLPERQGGLTGINESGDVDGRQPSTKVSPGCATGLPMTQGVSPYPISQFITRIARDLGYSTTDFVRSLGYHKNLEQGINRLGPWLVDGTGFEKILQQIAARYPDHADDLQCALDATNAIRAAEFETAWVERCKAEAETFRPFLHADGENTVPSGICIFGVSGGHRRWTSIQIPQIVLDLSGDQQLAALARLMAVYRKKHKRQVPFFGDLVGFKYVRLLDYLQFDADGRFVEQVNRPFRSAPCSVRLM